MIDETQRELFRKHFTEAVELADAVIHGERDRLHPREVEFVCLALTVATQAAGRCGSTARVQPWGGRESYELSDLRASRKRPRDGRVSR